MARLEITTPGGKSVFQIHDEFVTIGREVGNHLRLDDPAIAPVHLRLIHSQGGYRLEIADTALKVQVNGETCGARALQPNDRIQIGGTVLTFVDEHAAPPQPTPRPAVRPAPQKAPADATEREPAHSARTPPVHHAQPAPAAARGAAHHAAPAATHRATQHNAGHHQAGHHAGEHHAGHHHHHHHGQKQQGKMPPWLVWVSAGVGVSVVLLILLRVMGAGSYYREESSPEHWMQVAEAQFNDRDFTRALDSCQTAELRMSKSDVETQGRIRALRERIQKGMLRDQDQAALDGSKHALEAMQQLEASYPTTSRPRPVVRELARNAQQWLKTYSDIVRRYPESAADVQKAQDVYDRSAPLAQLDKPDDATDVLFAVERRLVPPRPLYREALFVADSYIQAHPNDPNSGKLKDRRDGVVSAAKGEFDRHEAEARRLLSAGQWAAARSELQLMRNVIVVDAWSKVADALEKDIQRASK